MNRNLILIVTNIVLFGANLLGYQYFRKPQVVLPPQQPFTQIFQNPVEDKPVPETPPHITFTVPQSDMKFQDIKAQLDKWHQEAPNITEVGVVGKTQNNTEIPYIRIGKKTGPKVLITACIHGNEHLCAMASMGAIGKLLDGYMKNDEITKLLNERDLYYMPVMCPESFMKNSRHDMGKDPNRNWTDSSCNDIQSIPSIQAVKEFHKVHQFKAMMSCHNFGKLYIYPWGYTRKPTENDADYKRVLGEMAKVTGYSPHQFRPGESAPPDYGYEADWFYKNGALAIVNEIGSSFDAHKDEIAREADVNLKAFIIWIREAPIVRK